VLHSKDTELEEGMKTQEHICAPLLKTHLRSKDTDKLQAEGVGTGTQHKWNWETNKQMDSVWVPRDSQYKIALSSHREFFLFGFSSAQP